VPFVWPTLFPGGGKGAPISGKGAPISGKGAAGSGKGAAGSAAAEHEWAHYRREVASK